MRRDVALLQHGRDALGPGDAAVLFSDMAETLDELTDGVLADIVHGEEAYAGSGLSTDVLRGIVRDNIESILQNLLGVSDSMHAPRMAGRVKAEYGIPMDSLLHAYRLAGLHLWESMMARSTTSEATAALLAASSGFWGMIDRFSGEAADTYRLVTQQRDRRDLESRRVLLVSIFEGDIGGDPTPVTRALGLSIHGDYAVFALEMGESTEDARRSIEERLRAIGITSVWTPWRGEHLGLLAGGTSGDMEGSLAEIAGSTPLRGGLSTPFRSLDEAPEAVNQALLALRCVPPQETGVHAYGSAPIDTILAAHPRYAAELSERTFGVLHRIDRADARMLLETLQTWYDTDGSTSACAVRLHCHRNTVLNRLERIAQLTGKSVMKPRQAAELFAALRATTIIGESPGPRAVTQSR
jgi:hypothetical protein